MPTAPAQTYLLENLRIKEISLVKRGANQHAKMLLWKSADGSPSLLGKARAVLARILGKTDEPRTTGEVLQDQMVWQAYWQHRDALDTAIVEISCADIPSDEKARKVLTSIQEFAAAAEAALSSVPAAKVFLTKLDDAFAAFGEDAIRKDAWDVEAFRTTLSDVEKRHGLVRPPRTVDAASPSAPSSTDNTPAADDAAKENTMPAPVEQPRTMGTHNQGQPAPAQPATFGAPAQPTKTAVECPGCAKQFTAEEHVAKARAVLDPAVQKQLDEATAETKRLAKENADLRKDTLRKECETKVDGYLLPGMDKAVAVGRLLKAHESGDKDDVAALEQLFAATTAVVKAHNAITRPRGFTGGDPRPDTAAGELAKRAQDVAKAKNIDELTARAEVLSADTALAGRVMNEERRARAELVA